MPRYSKDGKPFYVDVGTSMVAVRCASNHDVIVEYDHARRPQIIKIAEDMCDRMNREVEIRNSGDAAKLREAAKYVQSTMEGLRDPTDKNNAVFIRIWEIVSAALSAPLCNGEVGTVNERFERWQAFCDRYDMMCTGCPCESPNTFAYCFAKWECMPYEKGEENK